MFQFKAQWSARSMYDAMQNCTYVGPWAITRYIGEELENKQKARQLGAQVVSKRSRCEKREIFGATEAMKGSYEEVVELKVTFRGSDPVLSCSLPLWLVGGCLRRPLRA